MVELMLATAILASTCVVILGAFIGCSYLVDNYRDLTIAVNHGRTVLEEVKNYSYSVSTLSNLSNPPSSFASWDAWAISPSGGNCNTLNQEIVNVSFSLAGTNPRTVTVSVNYRGRKQIIDHQLPPASISLQARITSE